MKAGSLRVLKIVRLHVDVYLTPGTGAQLEELASP